MSHRHVTEPVHHTTCCQDTSCRGEVRDNGWIDRAGLEADIKRLGKSSYGEYLKRLLP